MLAIHPSYFYNKRVVEKLLKNLRDEDWQHFNWTQYRTRTDNNEVQESLEVQEGYEDHEVHSDLSKKNLTFSESGGPSPGHRDWIIIRL